MQGNLQKQHYWHDTIARYADTDADIVRTMHFREMGFGCLVEFPNARPNRDLSRNNFSGTVPSLAALTQLREL